MHLNPEQVKEIYELNAPNYYIQEAFPGVSYAQIQCIKTRTTHRETTQHLQRNRVQIGAFPPIVNADARPEKKIQSFLVKVDLPEDIVNECWTWKAKSVNNAGYPMFAGLIEGERPDNGFESKGPGITSGTGTMMQAVRFSYALFRGSIPRGKVLCHSKYCETKGKHKACLNPFHVEPGEQKDNVAQAIEWGTWRNTNKGANNYFTKLSEEEVKEIFLSKESHSAIARKYQVSDSAVSHIRNRKNWKHVTEHLIQPEYEIAPRGGTFKLTPEMVEEIFAMPGKNTEIGATFGISGSYVGVIKKGMHPLQRNKGK